VREAATICPRPAPCKLTFDLLTLKVVSQSPVTWPTSVPILVFLGLSIFELGPIYVTDKRQTSDAHHRLMPPPYGGRGIIIYSSGCWRLIKQDGGVDRRGPSGTMEHFARGHYICAVFTGVPTKTEDAFVSAVLSGHYIVACLACCARWSLKLLLKPP